MTVSQKAAWAGVCICLSLILTACGQPEKPPVETEAPAAETVQVSAEEYLEAAQKCVDAENIPAAVAVLEQALTETEDPRLRTMLQTLTEPTPLHLEYTGDAGEIFSVQSITAVETYTGTVCYTLDYSAAKGLGIRLSGSRLQYDFADFQTTGQPGQLVFEMDAGDLRNMKGTFQIHFREPEGSGGCVEVKTLWPEDILSAYEISYLHMDHNRTGNASVDSFLLEDMGDVYHFTVSYTAVEGLEITGLFETQDAAYSFWDEILYTDGEPGTLEFDIEKALFSEGKYMEVCFTDPSGRWVAAGFDFPMHLRRTLETARSDRRDLGYSAFGGRPAGYEIHDCYYQPLSNGFIRYTLDITAPVGSFVTVFAESAGGSDMLDQYLSASDRQVYVFDVQEETLAEARSLSILVAKPNSAGFSFEIPCGSFAVSTAATAVGEPVQMDSAVMDQPRNMDCGIVSAEAVPLDNGSLRYTITVQAEEEMKATVFDPPDGENLSLIYLSEPEEGMHTLCFDVEAAAAGELTEITMMGNFDGNRVFSAVFFNPGLSIPAESIPVTVLSVR